MKCASIFAAIGLSLGTFAGCARSNPAAPAVKTLANGIRVVNIHIPASTNVSIFTFLPLGLANDGPGKTQWSHLVEHLVIRSTNPSLRIANAETQPDHMRLDFYGSLNTWKTGVDHHRRWLEGIPFEKATMEAEKIKANSETDFAIRNQATHKFAIAAWNQGFRHGRDHAAVKGDVTRASLDEIQRYRNLHLAAPNQVTVCVVGGLDSSTVFTELKERLEGLTFKPSSRVPAKAPRKRIEMTWDLNARHLLIVWPIPDAADDDYPELLVAANVLMMRMFNDPELKRHAGMTLAGADLKTPEGTFFYVSSSLLPDANAADARKQIEAIMALAFKGSIGQPSPAMIAHQLAESLTAIPDLSQLSAPNISRGMIEGNVGLQWGMNESRHGDNRPALSKALRTVTAKQIAPLSGTLLSPDKAHVCMIQPPK